MANNKKTSTTNNPTSAAKEETKLDTAGKKAAVKVEEPTLDPGITKEDIENTLSNLDATEAKLKELKGEIEEFAVQNQPATEAVTPNTDYYGGREKVHPTFDPKVNTSWTNVMMLPPSREYFNYDHFRWNLGTYVVDSGFPVYRPNGPMLHIHMQLKFKEMLDCLHPNSILKRDRALIMKGSKAFADILHMAFNAPDVNPEQLDQPNIHNCFQLVFEWMNDPELGKVFNPQYIFAYVDRALPKLDWFFVNCADAVKKGNEPAEWREATKDLNYSWVNLRANWPRNHLPKYDLFMKYWVNTN